MFGETPETHIHDSPKTTRSLAQNAEITGSMSSVYKICGCQGEHGPTFDMTESVKAENWNFFS